MNPNSLSQAGGPGTIGLGKQVSSIWERWQEGVPELSPIDGFGSRVLDYLAGREEMGYFGIFDTQELNDSFLFARLSLDGANGGDLKGCAHADREEMLFPRWRKWAD